jgi:hypothetical protein
MIECNGRGIFSPRYQPLLDAWQVTKQIVLPEDVADQGEGRLAEENRR